MFGFYKCLLCGFVFASEYVKPGCIRCFLRDCWGKAVVRSMKRGIK